MKYLTPLSLIVFLSAPHLLQALGFDGDGYDGLRECHLQRVKTVKIKNSGEAPIICRYERIAHLVNGTTKKRALLIRSGTTRKITFFADRPFYYQLDNGCPTDCTQEDGHRHLSERVRVPKEQLTDATLVLNAHTKAAR